MKVFGRRSVKEKEDLPSSLASSVRGRFGWNIGWRANGGTFGLKPRSIAGCMSVGKTLGMACTGAGEGSSGLLDVLPALRISQTENGVNRTTGGGAGGWRACGRSGDFLLDDSSSSFLDKDSASFCWSRSASSSSSEDEVDDGVVFRLASDFRERC